MNMSSTIVVSEQLPPLPSAQMKWTRGALTLADTLETAKCLHASFGAIPVLNPTIQTHSYHDKVTASACSPQPPRICAPPECFESPLFLAGGVAESPEAAEHRLLTLAPVVPTLLLAPVVKVREDKKLLEMHSLALIFQHVCTPIMKLQRSLGGAIAMRMRPREGGFLWQTATGCVENFPRMACLQILPDSMRQGEEWSWSVPSMLMVAELIGPLIEKSSSFSAGASKALITASERVVRVVATVIPSPLFWWKERQGVDYLYYEFQYVLADEDVELHPPKDANRNEIELAPELEASIRQQILSDLQPPSLAPSSSHWRRSLDASIQRTEASPSARWRLSCRI